MTNSPKSKRKIKRAPAPQKRGRFIVLDGPDGAGKSTQAKRLAERLIASGREVLLLREPGATAAGEAIRTLVLEQRKAELCPSAEAFLFQAARAQLIDEQIRPALARGAWVICDRFTLSTLVYQGLAGKVGPEKIDQLSKIATGGLKPDRYFVIWVPLEMGIERRLGRAADRMESKGDAFLAAVSRGFKREAQAHPSRYTLINGKRGIDELHSELWRHLEPLLP